MAKNTQLSNFLVNGQADYLTAQASNGFVRLYAGTEESGADVALSAQVLLATLGIPATAAPAASGGLITFNALTAGTAVATGTASFYRVFKADGTTVLFQGNIGTADKNMVLATTSIVSGASVTATSMTHNVAKNAAGF